MADIVLRIELLGTEPLVWRRFLVPEQINLRRLHEVIQMVMGWENAHLYEFECGGRLYGEPDPSGMFDDDSTAQAANAKLKTLLPRLNKDEFHYVYDFGDDWRHRLIVEQSGLENSNPCPRLLDGAMACPPEDIGGPPGYDALKAELDDDEDEYSETLEMIGPDFDPTKFNKAYTVAALRRIQAGFRRV